MDVLAQVKDTLARYNWHWRMLGFPVTRFLLFAYKTFENQNFSLAHKTEDSKYWISQNDGRTGSSKRYIGQIQLTLAYAWISCYSVFAICIQNIWLLFQMTNKINDIHMYGHLWVWLACSIRQIQIQIQILKYGVPYVTATRAISVGLSTDRLLISQESKKPGILAPGKLKT